MRRGARQLGASPVLIGAVTVMVAIVAVFISYQANNGLPFVPTYQLEAQVPNGAKLVKGNEVRAGGFRVGIVKDIKSARDPVNGTERVDRGPRPEARQEHRAAGGGHDAVGAAALRARPEVRGADPGPRQARPSRTATRSRSRTRRRTRPSSRTCSRRSRPRRATDARKSLQGFGNSIAGRGPAINTTIRELEPFTRYLLPVMRNLSDPKTELRGFFPGLGAAAAQAAPVAQVQARWFGEMATTFAAIGRDPEALRETIEESPSTLQAATESFQVQTPFLARFAAVSRDLQPGAAELPRTLPLVNDALQAGVPGLRADPAARRGPGGPVRGGRGSGRQPEHAARAEGPAHRREGRAPGARVRGALPDGLQLPRLLLQPARHAPVGHRGGRHHGAHPRQAGGHPAAELARHHRVHASRSTGIRTRRRAQQSLHTQYGGPAIDSSGRADCQGGQTGYPNSLSKGDRWNAKHIVVDGNTPGLAGGTFKSRELGIDNLKDVP